MTHTSPIKSAGDTSAAGRSPEIVPAGQIGAAGQVVIPFMFEPAYNIRSRPYVSSISYFQNMEEYDTRS